MVGDTVELKCMAVFNSLANLLLVSPIAFLFVAAIFQTSIMLLLVPAPSSCHLLEE